MVLEQLGPLLSESEADGLLQWLERIGVATRRQTTVTRQVLRHEAQRLEPPLDDVMRAAFVKGMLVMLSQTPRRRRRHTISVEGGGCMLCEQCKQAPATVHITQVINDVRRESHLCEKCMLRITGDVSLSWPTISFNELFGRPAGAGKYGRLRIGRRISR